MTVPFNKTATWQIDYTPAFSNALLACNASIQAQITQAAQANDFARIKILMGEDDQLEQLVMLMDALEIANHPLNLLRQVIDQYGSICPNRYMLASGKFSAYYDVDLPQHICQGYAFIRTP